MVRFTHLHVHSHYSMLDGMSKVPDLVKKAKKDGMYAMALTDHGNMFGIKDFLDTVNKENGKVRDKIKELEARIKEVESEHTPQSLRDSSPNLGEQPDGAGLGEQLKGALEARIRREVESVHTPQSLRDSSPNLGEQLDGAGLGEQLKGALEARIKEVESEHTPQSLRDSSPNLGEQPDGAGLGGQLKGALEARIKEVESEHTPQSLRDSSPNLGEQLDGAGLGEQLDGARLGERLKELQEELAKVKGQIFKPIVGTEAYCARRTLYDKDKNYKEINPENGRERVVDRSGYHLILLAKNLQGYHSLCKLASIAYTDGFYDRPRIDHNVLEQYKEGLIVCSACLGGEIPQLIMAGKLEEAEKQVLWFKERFGDDYYIELMRHKTDKPNANYDTYRMQMKVEPELIRLARKHNIKLIATNDAHFVLEEHGDAHDHLICLATQKDYDDPNRMHYTKQEWLKSPDEMAAVFADLPEALENTMEIADKVEVYSIESDPLMPVFPIPESFGKEEEWREKFTEEDLFNEFTRNEKGEVVMSREAAEKKIKKLGGYKKLYRIKFEADYLEHLVWEGARKRYSRTDPSVSPNPNLGEQLKGALEAKSKEVESVHTPQSLRDSSPNLGEQPDGANLGEQLKGALEAKSKEVESVHTPQSLRDSSPNLGEQPDGANIGEQLKGVLEAKSKEVESVHTPQSLRDSSPNLGEQLDGANLGEQLREYRGEDLSEEVRERIIFELHTIKTMGFPGYFLIVSDYIRAAREELGVSVGPGRGSAAGSVVAYCLWITDLDPLRYDLLFERFLNPDRISLPDIDVDFDDAGRGKVLDWVTKKYGKERVAHIITYGTMATKSSIADVGRVEKVPLATVNQLKAYIPDRGFADNIKDENGKAPKVNLKNCYKYVPELKSIMQDGPDDLRRMLTYAEELEDTNRQTGIHACGVIIGAQDISDVAPVCVIKDKDTDEDVLVTQYDGHVVETVGLIKMDFLGLKNLTIIKNCVDMVKKGRGEEIDVDHLPLDDELTYKLFCDGNTVGVFQFESAGMQKYLRELQPHVIDDLIAMNALYRPGPMDNIPEFIDRKQGRKPISYDIPVMEKYLKDTYGITVYQEQVMLLSRLLANFTRGQSDTLRKAMGKKQIEKMNELEVLFYEGGEKNGHPKEILSKIWEEWKKFASYAFNKSHAACYSWVAYQTAYLKAHYPAEYMAAVMTSAQTDIKRVTELMDDCKKQGVEVAAPSVNDSDMDFSVDSQGRIRFGLQAISGMGEAASSVIIAEREKNGPYQDIFDFLKRVDMHSVNKKNMEVLVKAGAFDGIGAMHRAQYFHKENALETTPTYLDLLVRWAIRRQDGAASNQMSIFSMSEELAEEDHPPVPECEEWSTIERCRAEKEVISTYLSGHPLDDFKHEMRMFTNIGVEQLGALEQLSGREVRFAGMVSGAKGGVSAKGNPYGSMVIDDYSGSYELRLYDDEYTSFKNFFTDNTFVYVVANVRTISYKDKKTGAEKSFTRMRISSMMLLSKVMDKYTQKLSFTVPLERVDEQFCKGMEKLAKKHKGGVPLQAIVVDAPRNLSLTLNTPELRVSAHDVIAELEQLPGVTGVQPILKS